MRKIITFLLIYPFTMMGQIINIPNAGFEAILVHKGIDSDGLINGQILTEDALNVTSLNLNEDIPFESFPLFSVEGLQEFTNLQNLFLIYAQIEDGSLPFNNFSQLTTLTFLSNNYSTIDLSANTLLEKLDIGNASLDVGDHNMMQHLDLRNNTQLNKINAWNLFSLQSINMRHNTAGQVTIYLGNETNYPYNVCIEVEDAAAATNNLSPYDNWTVYGNHFFNENCVLSTEKWGNENYSIYPNPTSDFLYLKENATIENNINSVQILDTNGRLIKNFKDHFYKLDIQELPKGNYVLIINTQKGNKTEKFIKK